MRDTLTALAGVVILILAAALAAPPFIDWAGQRDLIDRGIGGSLGLPARSEGRIEVRLLPSPRLRLDRLQLGGVDPGRPSLDARFVKAELALAPLLKGEFRFTETRIGRAEVKLPVTEGDAILVPPDLGRVLSERDLVIEDLRIQQALVTTQVPATGRTDQFLVEGLRLRAPSLAGPWQAEGLSGGIPFRFASGTIGPDGSATLKVAGGGEGKPRFEADARVALKAVDPAAAARGGSRAMIPEAEGSVRVVVGPSARKDSAGRSASATIPFTLGGKFKARGPITRFEGVVAELDPGGQAVRLAGSGRIDLRNWRAGLTLESRRLNLDGLIHSSAGQAMAGRALATGGIDLPVMLDLDLKVESLALGFEDWSDIAFKGVFDRSGGLVLRRFSGTAPGAARLDASGEVDIAPSPRFAGHLVVDASNSEGFGRYLRKLGAEGAALALLDGRPIRFAGDLAAGADETALKNLRLALGEAILTGSARYAKAQGGARGRFEAQLDARGIDIAELPPFGGLLPGLERHDVGLTLKAREVRYGTAGPGNGTIAASIQSDGASLVVDRLDIADLAGANAKLSGRIAADGSGRIVGRVAAPVAAPLLALLDRVWIAEARLIPRFLREGALDLDISLEREAGEADTLRGSAKGKAAESNLEGSLLTRAGRIDALDLTLAAPRAGRWFGREDIAALRQPGRLVLSGKRTSSSPNLDLTLSGTIAGLTLSTAQPLVLGPDQGPPESGRLRVETADLAPYLALVGGAGTLPALPADLTLTLARPQAGLRAEIAGRIGGANASGILERSLDGAITGKAALGRLSLPALAAALVLPTDPRGTGEDAGRFAPVPAHPRADIALSIESLDLGRGLIATNAALHAALDGETLTLRDVSGALAGGRIAGSATLTRQGGSASVSGEGRVSDAAIRELAGEGPLRGRVSAALRYSTTGDSAAALAANLGGSGEVTLSDFSLPGADPGATERALARALAEDDPLREGRVQAILSEEFSAGPLTVKGPVTTSATLVGGILRSGQIGLDLAKAGWNGGFTLDLRQPRLEARGTLVAAAAPKGWSGAKPSVQLGFAGPLSGLQRAFDPGPLSNGLAALVLQRELEKIELSDADQAERQRRRARIDMDRTRAAALKAEADRLATEKAAAEKAAADKAAREKAAAEEAARLARMRAQQAAAEEAARQARDRLNAEEAARRERIESQRGPDPDDAPPYNRPPQP